MIKYLAEKKVRIDGKSYLFKLYLNDSDTLSITECKVFELKNIMENVPFFKQYNVDTSKLVFTFTRSGSHHNYLEIFKESILEFKSNKDNIILQENMYENLEQCACI